MRPFAKTADSYWLVQLWWNLCEMGGWDFSSFHEFQAFVNLCESSPVSLQVEPLLVHLLLVSGILGCLTWVQPIVSLQVEPLLVHLLFVSDILGCLTWVQPCQPPGGASAGAPLVCERHPGLSYLRPALLALQVEPLLVHLVFVSGILSHLTWAQPCQPPGGASAGAPLGCERYSGLYYLRPALSASRWSLCWCTSWLWAVFWAILPEASPVSL